MDFWGDVLVSVLGSLGSLGVAWVIYQSTRRDEADRLAITLREERLRLDEAFAAERRQREDDRQRERRQLDTRGLSDILNNLAMKSLQLGSAVESLNPTWIREVIADLPTMQGEVLSRVLLLTRYLDLYADVSTAGAMCIELSNIGSRVNRNSVAPIQSWLDDFATYTLYVSNFALTLRNRIYTFEDDGTTLPVNNDALPVRMSPGMPLYPNYPTLSMPKDERQS